MALVLNSKQLATALSVVCVAGSTGCGTTSTTRYGTPRTVDFIPDRVYPAEVEYQLLGVAKGKACAAVQQQAPGFGTGGAGDVDPGLAQQAKYAAIEVVPDADNLLFVRTKTEREGEQDCVTVTGRAYKVVVVRAPAFPRPPAGPEAGR